jgi:hypothetical protein
MPLNHYEPPKSPIVGSFIPPEDFTGFAHFAILDADSQELEATIGPIGSITEDLRYGFGPEDFLAAAASIEQAQLYGASPVMFGILEEIYETKSREIEEKAKAEEEITVGEQDLLARIGAVLSAVTDIREAAGRLLGKDNNPMRQIGAAYEAKTGGPLITRIAGDMLGASDFSRNVGSYNQAIEKRQKKLPRKRR